MKSIQLCRLTDDEYGAIVALNNLVYPDDPATVDDIRHFDSARNPAHLFERYLLTWDGVTVGDGAIYVPFWAYEPGRYSISITVHPDYERRGIGGDFYAFAVERLSRLTPALRLLQSRTRSDKPQGIRFLEKRGFTVAMRWWMSVIDLAGFAPEPYAGLLDTLRASGVEFCTAAVLADRDPDWQRNIYATDREAFLDEPTPGKPTPLPFDEYATLVFGHPRFRGEWFFLALDGDRVVGLSELPENADDPTTRYTGFTGVARSHRRRGIATALKVIALEEAARQNVRRVYTGNEEHNPMYQINRRLGFQPTVASLAYEKQVDFDK